MVGHAILSNKIGSPMLENDSASETRAFTIQHRFWIGQVYVSCLTRSFIEEAWKFVLAPFWNPLWRLKWSNVLLNLGTMTSERPIFLPWGCSWRSRQGWWAKIYLGPPQYSPWYVSTETDCPWVVTCRSNSFLASQNIFSVCFCFSGASGAPGRSVVPLADLWCSSQACGALDRPVVTSQNMGLVSCFCKSRGGRWTFSLLIRDPFED